MAKAIPLVAAVVANISPTAKVDPPTKAAATTSTIVAAVLSRSLASLVAVVVVDVVVVPIVIAQRPVVLGWAFTMQMHCANSGLHLSVCDKHNTRKLAQFSFEAEREAVNMIQKSALYILLAILSKRKKRNRRKRKSVWCKTWFTKRQKLGQTALLNELEFTSKNDFKNYVRMDKSTFENLLSKVAPFITKKDTLMRPAISAYHRLSLTLRFLASGNSFEDLKFLTAISPQAIGKIVFETCDVIIKVLYDYIKLPENDTEWKMIAEAFDQRWNFPHCIGAIDGKHINITKPPGTGSLYFNYKKNFSIILMAIVNADSEFMMIDVGANGRASDAGLFSESSFFSRLKANELKIPHPEAIPYYNTELPYVFVADDAFPLMTNIMKPFSHKSMEKNHIIFNYRLSRARGNVEMVFGQLSSRFRILLKTINLSPEKVTTITMTCCYLHNYLLKRKDRTYRMSNIENVDNGSQDDSQNDLQSQTIRLTPFNTSSLRNVSSSVKGIRNNFCEYFSTAGAVPWQNHIYEKLSNKTHENQNKM